MADRLTGLAAPGAREDVLIVGAGLAGLFLALNLAPRPVRVISPAPLGKAASSAWAQGGLAAALAPTDSPEAHAADTVAAGSGLVDPVIARMIAEEGPARVQDLIRLGVPFDRTPEGALALSLEAAHSHPRVARVAGDLAGRAIMEALVDAVQAAGHVEVISGVKAVALIDAGKGCGGIIAEDRDGARRPIAARETVLCTGGTGGLYRVTTNPKSARGDALAMAHGIGAALADLEFVQFHPTAIDIGRDPAPLATEALRGEGARLVDADGTPFMARYHPEGELAPRDVVARAIHCERAEGRTACLDARDAIGAEFPEAFPTVFAACQAAGIDPRTDLIPVAPAAHYHMGGIVTDLWGATSVPGLSACGECAATGAHGANRLASNSLLEACVFAERTSRRLREGELAGKGSEGAAELFPELPEDSLSALRRDMADLCGVVRDADGLERLDDRIAALAGVHGWSRELVAATLMCASARAREESRGGHYRSDFPDAGPLAERSFIGESPVMLTETLKTP
jgi:L-aspartate oxidase